MATTVEGKYAPATSQPYGKIEGRTHYQYSYELLEFHDFQ